MLFMLDIKEINFTSKINFTCIHSSIKNKVGFFKIESFSKKQHQHNPFIQNKTLFTLQLTLSRTFIFPLILYHVTQNFNRYCSLSSSVKLPKVVIALLIKFHNVKHTKADDMLLFILQWLENRNEMFIEANIDLLQYVTWEKVTTEGISQAIVRYSKVIHLNEKIKKCLYSEIQRRFQNEYAITTTISNRSNFNNTFTSQQSSLYNNTNTNGNNCNSFIFTFINDLISSCNKLHTHYENKHKQQFHSLITTTTPSTISFTSVHTHSNNNGKPSSSTKTPIPNIPLRKVKPYSNSITMTSSTNTTAITSNRTTKQGSNLYKQTHEIRFLKKKSKQRFNTTTTETSTTSACNSSKIPKNLFNKNGGNSLGITSITTINNVVTVPNANENNRYFTNGNIVPFTKSHNNTMTSFNKKKSNSATKKYIHHRKNKSLTRSTNNRGCYRANTPDYPSEQENSHVMNMLKHSMNSNSNKNNMRKCSKNKGKHYITYSSPARNDDMFVMKRSLSTSKKYPLSG